MRPRKSTFAWLAPVVGIAVLLGGAPAANAQAPRSVDRWIERNAVPLAIADPAAPLGDLASLRRSIGNAAIVGLGESVHGTAEETTLKHPGGGRAAVAERRRHDPRSSTSRARLAQDGRFPGPVVRHRRPPPGGDPRATGLNSFRKSPESGSVP